MYAAGALGIAALSLAFRFGGRADVLSTQQPRRGDETLH
jgi:hypothetical protein